MERTGSRSAAAGLTFAVKEVRAMGDPFERVATGLNRDLAWIAGGLLALGGAIVTAGYVAVEVLVHRHRDHPG
jgi:hypothetical protein